MYQRYKDHVDRLPFVRIKKIELIDFKGVNHGIIEFNCNKEFTPFDTKSDILGLYGQNGSGKSSLVEAISTLKGLIGGYKLGSIFAKCVDVNSDFARIYIEFEFQYRDGVCAAVTYEMKMECKEVEDKNKKTGEGIPKLVKRPFISEEVIKTNLYVDGTIGRMHAIVDTKEKLLCADSLEKYYFESDSEEVRNDIIYIKRKSYDDSRSFVFSDDLSEKMSLYNTEEHHSKYYEVLSELQLFVERYLFVVGTRTSGLVQLRAGIPIYLPQVDRPILINEKTIVPANIYNCVINGFDQINMVVDTIIPGLQIMVEGIPTTMEDGSEGRYVSITAQKGGKTFPFEYESDGIIKIVSILAYYVFAFNCGSVTLVVDELDSGVFEYLLGELLQIFEESGKGQFVFTSHNLRPLEVIDKKFIRFTTADPFNRYYKLKNIGSTNNLRDLYLREVQLGNQDVEIYRKTKSFKIAKALKAAGMEDNNG